VRERRWKPASMADEADSGKTVVDNAKGNVVSGTLGRACYILGSRLATLPWHDQHAPENMASEQRVGYVTLPRFPFCRLIGTDTLVNDYMYCMRPDRIYNVRDYPKKYYCKSVH